MKNIYCTAMKTALSDFSPLPVLLTLVRAPCGSRELWVSLIGCWLPTRSSRPAAAAQVRRMKQATVEVKSPTSMVWISKEKSALLKTTFFYLQNV